MTCNCAAREVIAIEEGFGVCRRSEKAETEREREKRSLVFVFVLRVWDRALKPYLHERKVEGFVCFLARLFAQWVGSNMPELPNGLFQKREIFFFFFFKKEKMYQLMNCF